MIMTKMMTIRIRMITVMIVMKLDEGGANYTQGDARVQSGCPAAALAVQAGVADAMPSRAGRGRAGQGGAGLLRGVFGARKHTGPAARPRVALAQPAAAVQRWAVRRAAASGDHL